MHRYICASLESWVELERNQGDSSSRGHGDKSQCERGGGGAVLMSRDLLFVM